MLYCKCMNESCPNLHYGDDTEHHPWVELTNGSTVPIAHPATFHLEELEYGENVPGVTCPDCAGELVYTQFGAYCDWDMSFVPLVDNRVVVIEDEATDETDWNDDAPDPSGD